MSEKLTKENAEKFRFHVKKWSKENGISVAALSRKMGFNSGYIANILSCNMSPSHVFFYQLKKVTGLERSDYCD